MTEITPTNIALLALGAITAIVITEAITAAWLWRKVKMEGRRVVREI